MREYNGGWLLAFHSMPNVHATDFDYGKHRDSKEFDRIANVCVMRATEALKTPGGPFNQMHCNQLADIFTSMAATQRGIRRMLDFEGPIDPQSVDALLLARVQLEGVFSLCLMLEDPLYVTAYVQDHWRKQYVEYLIAREETKLLARYQGFETPELQRLVILGNQFGITPAHIHTVDTEELGIPLPAGVVETPIHPFPTPGKGIRKIMSSPEKKRMLERLYAKYVYLCSFAHGLPQANLFKNMFDSRFPDRKFVRDSDVKHSYEHQVVGEAYITSFMSIAQCTAELSVLYPNNIADHRGGVPCMGATRRSKPFHESRLGNTDPEAPWRVGVMLTSLEQIVGDPEAIHIAVLSPLLTLTPGGGLDVDACIPRDSKRKPCLQILASVYGNRDDLSFPRFGVDMVTSINALERPAVRLN